MSDFNIKCITFDFGWGFDPCSSPDPRAGFKGTYLKWNGERGEKRTGGKGKGNGMIEEKATGVDGLGKGRRGDGRN